MSLSKFSTSIICLVVVMLKCVPVYVAGQSPDTTYDVSFRPGSGQDFLVKLDWVEVHKSEVNGETNFDSMRMIITNEYEHMRWASSKRPVYVVTIRDVEYHRFMTGDTVSFSRSQRKDAYPIREWMLSKLPGSTLSFAIDSLNQLSPVSNSLEKTRDQYANLVHESWDVDSAFVDHYVRNYLSLSFTFAGMYTLSRLLPEEQRVAVGQKWLRQNSTFQTNGMLLEGELTDVKDGKAYITARTSYFSERQIQLKDRQVLSYTMDQQQVSYSVYDLNLGWVSKIHWTTPKEMVPTVFHDEKGREVAKGQAVDYLEGSVAIEPVKKN